MKKITIVGRGTVGTLAVAHFRRHTDWQIDWLYDPDIEPTSVGEGTNLTLPRSLAQNMGFDSVDMDNIMATPKLGIWKRGWGSGKDFIHTFPADSHGIHFSAVEFQKYAFNKLIQDKRITTIESNSKNYEYIDSDFIMICTGTPREFTNEYVMRDKIPVNAATVFQCPWDNTQFNYSLTFARKFGWVFGIPLKNRCSIGYVYNKNFNSQEEVTNDVQEILEEFKLTPSFTRTLQFSNYSRKSNNTYRVVYNGNASFFLEPLEATSTALSDLIIRNAYDMWTGLTSSDDIKNTYNTYINNIESMICLHYFSGSPYDTPFWSEAQRLASIKINQDMKENKKFINMIRNAVNYDVSNYIFPQSNEIGTWPLRSYVQNIYGLGIKEKLQQLL